MNDDEIPTSTVEISTLRPTRVNWGSPVRGEDEGVDRVSGLEGVEVLALVEVPEHGDSILSSGRAERTIGRDGDGVDVTGVTVVVGAELALGELPDLRRMRVSESPPALGFVHRRRHVESAILVDN